MSNNRVYALFRFFWRIFLNASETDAYLKYAKNIYNAIMPKIADNQYILFTEDIIPAINAMKIIKILIFLFNIFTTHQKTPSSDNISENMLFFKVYNKKNGLSTIF